MSIRSKWLIVLIGNDKTGKTTLQKKLIRLLSDDNRDIRLDCNLSFKITHPYLIRKLRDFSVGNRSIQEKLDVYESVPDFFKNHFKEADLCFISSHLSPADTKKIIFEGRQRYYNVCGVFFSNSIDGNARVNSIRTYAKETQNPVCK
jgi:GTPase SAR1 family protein